MKKQEYFTDQERKFLMTTEPRESNPKRVKAILLEKMSDGSFQKINAWKPGASAPKRSASASGISQEAYSKFEKFKNELEKEERKLGLAD